MDGDMYKFGLVERVTLAAWMLIMGAWTAYNIGDPEVGTVMMEFNLVAIALVVGGGPILRGGVRWVRPRIAARV